MQHDLVIVGGGAGGLELAARLGRHYGRAHGPARVLLIDQSVFHIWKPTLHEVAVGTLDIHQEGLSYPILARRNHFAFTLGKLTALDVDARRLTLAAITDADGEVLVPERHIGFERLVLALGSGSNFFGTPGAHRFCHVLERAADAERFRRTLMGAFARTAYQPPGPLAVAIVGGGATGVELAAEMLEAHQEALRSLPPNQHFALTITIVEAAPRLLAGLPERISAQALEALLAKGIDVRTRTKVVRAQRHLLITERDGQEQHLSAELIVWAAGIKGADRNAGYGLAVNRVNQFIVDEQLRTSATGIYAMGDCAAVNWPARQGRQDAQDERIKQVPARAQAAHQQASYLFAVLRAQEAGRSFDKPFVYRDFGSLVSLGENKGVGNLMGSLSGRNFFVQGLIAKWMYVSLHLMHHRAILGVGGTAVLALARLLQRRISGRLKLH